MKLLAYLLAWLASLLGQPDTIAVEHARSAAAVAAARASMSRDESPPRPRAVCEKCQDTGWVRIDSTTRRQCECQRR